MQQTTKTTTTAFLNIQKLHIFNLITNREPWSIFMGDNSCSRGHWFESRRSILDGHDIFHITLVLELYRLFEKDGK